MDIPRFITYSGSSSAGGGPSHAGLLVETWDRRRTFAAPGIEGVDAERLAARLTGDGVIRSSESTETSETLPTDQL
jgi:hypothetical protein